MSSEHGTRVLRYHIGAVSRESNRQIIRSHARAARRGADRTVPRVTNVTIRRLFCRVTLPFYKLYSSVDILTEVFNRQRQTSHLINSLYQVQKHRQFHVSCN